MVQAADGGLWRGHRLHPVVPQFVPVDGRDGDEARPILVSISV